MNFSKNLLYKKSLFCFCLCFVFKITFAQTIEIKHVNPSNWFVGMKNNKLQIMLHGNNIADCNINFNYPGITLVQKLTVQNPNYLFLDLELAPNTKAGIAQIILTKNVTVLKKKKKKIVEQSISIPYEFKARTAQYKPITDKDLIYLILPDRFSNGDPSNDKFAAMADTSSDRKNPFLRHGGDLKGIENHLDYIADLGMTTLWLNPVIENDQPLTNENGTLRSAYHGYGFTDHYNVDRRLGGNIAYKSLIDKAHAKGLKIIQDAVYNHAGQNHWFLKDLPEKNWLNNWDTYTNTTYRDEPIVDPYASEIDKKELVNGWFVPFLPDLNHKNLFVEKFLIQHALWTVEYFNIDGWRIDTYMYNDHDFMLKCNEALLEEYPQMYITGENSVSTVLSQANLVDNNFNFGSKGTLPSANDFVLESAILKGLNDGRFDWGDGLNKVYSVLAQDKFYANPNKNLTFLDNHDHDRFFSIIGEDMSKYKMGIMLLLTLRGVPQLYYGTENLTKNFKNPTDAEVRKDFEGGWPEDLVNKFTPAGRNSKEEEAFQYVKKLANYRKNNDGLASGKLLQFMPKNGVYVYFRLSEKGKYMIIINQNNESKTLDLARYNQGIGNSQKAFDVMNNKLLDLKNGIELPKTSAILLELK